MIEIKKLNPEEVSDFKQLVEIFKMVFENEEPIADDTHLGQLLAKPDFLVFVIRKNNQVVGGLTIYVLHRYYGSKPIAYMYDVGISPDFQGQGLGKALIAEVCSYCKENGYEDAYVEAESDDIDAINFYRKTNFTSEKNATLFIYDFH